MHAAHVLPDASQTTIAELSARVAELTARITTMIDALILANQAYAALAARVTRLEERQESKAIW